MGGTVLCAACLHGMEAGIWAVIYLKLGVFPDFGSSMLYSLNSITSYGKTELSLNDPGADGSTGVAERMAAVRADLPHFCSL